MQHLSVPPWYALYPLSRNTKDIIFGDYIDVRKRPVQSVEGWGPPPVCESRVINLRLVREMTKAWSKVTI